MWWQRDMTDYTLLPISHCFQYTMCVNSTSKEALATDNYYY